MDARAQAVLDEEGIPAERVTVHYLDGNSSTLDGLLESAFQKSSEDASVEDAYCIVFDVPPNYADEVENEHAALYSYKHVQEYYDISKRYILITMPPKRVHESATVEVVAALDLQLQEMGLDHVLKNINRPGYTLTDGSTKQPDAVYELMERHSPGLGGTPRIVIETAVGEGDRKLRADAEKWLNRCAHQPVVLTLSARAKEQAAVVCRWTAEAGVPKVAEKLTIRHDPESSRYIVDETGQDALVIPFCQVFGRAPSRRYGEDDLRIDITTVEDTLLSLKDIEEFASAGGV
ncbi:hypothetical protein KEM55_007303 [Ascosphaera atra]|nr:hypothetical protein KEM55_007303 [Ascosphaera atra]